MDTRSTASWVYILGACLYLVMTYRRVMNTHKEDLEKSAAIADKAGFPAWVPHLILAVTIVIGTLFWPIGMAGMAYSKFKKTSAP